MDKHSSNLRHWPILILTTMALAGCMGDNEEATNTETGTGTTAPTVPAAFAIANNATGCYEAVGILLVDTAVAQASLPPNWTAADAQLILGTPGPTGRAAIWFNGYTCAESAMAQGGFAASELGVLVQPPRFSENLTDAPTFNLYEVMHYTDSVAQLQAMESIQANVTAANVTVQHEAQAGGVEEGSVRVSAGNVSAYTFDFVGLIPSTFNGTADFWQESPQGLMRYHFEIDAVAVRQGTLSACSFDDPVSRAVAGTQSCSGQQTAVVVIPEQSWRSEFRWHPGLRVLGPA